MKKQIILQNKKRQKRKKILIIGGVLLALMGTFVLLELTNTTYFLHERKAVSGTIPSKNSSKDTSNSTDKEKDTVSTSNGADSPESPKEGDTPQPLPTSKGPEAPFGDFISNHHPNLDSAPAPSAVESVCNTTPGAQCQLSFTNMDGVIKTLEIRTTDGTGAAMWSWDVKTAGFTVGTWKIKAIATLNGQTKVTESTLHLEIGP
jgi:hypothetical protein